MRVRPPLLKRFVFLTANADNPLYETFLKSVQAPVIAKPAPVESVLANLAAVLASPTPGTSPSSTAKP